MSERTPSEWLNILTKKLDSQIKKVESLRRYMTGQAPLPEMGENLREQWEKFQRKSVTNSAGLIVSTLAERIIPNGVTIGDGNNDALMGRARRIWRDNRLDVVFADAIYDCLGVGVAYLLIQADEDGKATITSEDPLQVYSVPDPLRPWKSVAAIKVWRDTIDKTDHLIIWADGMESHWSRQSYDGDKILSNVVGKWDLDTQAEYEGSVPVMRLDNKGYKSEFEDHTGLIDRINWGILQRLCTTAMQSFKQRALETPTEQAGDGLPEVDENGDQIDYKDIFVAGPGALWELPPGVKLWESSATDIRPMLDAVKDDWRELAAVTQTPLSIMLPDSANQSASGAEAPQKQLVSKARDRINRLQPAMALTLVKALKLEGTNLGEETLEVLFEPPHAVSITEKYAAAAQAKAAGESLESIQRNILGYSPEQIATDRQQRLSEQFALGLGAPTRPVSSIQAADKPSEELDGQTTENIPAK